MVARKQIVYDADFGQIFIVTRRTVRNVTMRMKEDGLHVTTPPYRSVKALLDAIAPFRERLLKLKADVSPPPFGWDYRLEAECFRLWLEPSRLKHFKETGGRVSASVGGTLGRAVWFVVSDGEDYQGTLQMGKLLVGKAYQPVVLPDAASRTPDGLCHPARAGTYAGDEPRFPFLGVIRPDDGGESVGVAQGVACLSSGVLMLRLMYVKKMRAHHSSSDDV